MKTTGKRGGKARCQIAVFDQAGLEVQTNI